MPHLFPTPILARRSSWLFSPSRNRSPASSVSFLISGMAGPLHPMAAPIMSDPVEAAAQASA